jgi:hypothetical protein
MDGQLSVLASSRLTQNTIPERASLVSTVQEPDDESPSQYSDMWGDLTSNGRTEHNIVTEVKTHKLDLEKILRSFLLLASERDSAGLIRRVLQVLLQVTCTHYGCFATEDPATGNYRLKAFGSHDNMQSCDKSFIDAKDVAPTVLLSHAIITKKVSYHAWAVANTADQMDLTLFSSQSPKRMSTQWTMATWSHASHSTQPPAFLGVFSYCHSLCKADSQA